MNSPFTSKIKLLIIEDNADQWYVIRWALNSQFPEAEPVWKANAGDALAYLETCLEGRQPIPQLILLDLYLPGRAEGYHLLETLKDHYLYKEIPIVVISFSHDSEDIRDAYQRSTNSYVVKPITYQEWLAFCGSLRQYWGQTTTLPRLL
ncbi:response regulator [Spirosoma harenae]